MRKNIELLISKIAERPRNITTTDRPNLNGSLIPPGIGRKNRQAETTMQYIFPPGSKQLN
jgi:hypothetical protein